MNFSEDQSFEFILNVAKFQDRTKTIVQVIALLDLATACFAKLVIFSLFLTRSG